MRKQKANFLDTHSMFAVMVPMLGFLSWKYGTPVFVDKLPRLSGVFATKEDAEAEIAKAIAFVEEKIRVYSLAPKDEWGTREWWISHGENMLYDCKCAFVVLISMEVVA